MLWFDRQAMSIAWNVQTVVGNPLLFLVLFSAFMTFGACTSGKGVGFDDPQELVGRAIEESAHANIEVRKGALWYQMVVRDTDLSVRVRLLEPASQTSFFMPGSWAGQSDFSNDIVLSGALGPRGALNLTVERSSGRIDVETHNVAWVELHYTVKLARRDEIGDRFRPRLRDNTFFAYAPTFLILPSDGISRSLRDIAVEMRVPDDWHVVTTWKPARVSPSRVATSENVHGFIIPQVGDLRDAFVAAGPHLDRHIVDLDGHRLTVAFEPGFDHRSRPLVEAITVLVQTYSKRFGYQPEVTVFVHRAITTPDPSGDPTQSANVMRGMGRRGGFVLELPLQGTLDEPTLVLTAHEAFHMWNGHELIPDPRHEKQTRWFKEGVTHYIALQTLRELGMVNGRGIRAELAQAAQFYMHNPAARGASAGEADHVRLPYDLGLLLAVALDASLRVDSNNTLTLSDWVATLIDQSRRALFRYDEAALRRSLAAITGPGSRSLAVWDRHLRRNEVIDVHQLFESVGLHWLESSNDTPPRLLPLGANHTMYRALFAGPTD